jgi:hypothetical protein
MDKETYAQCLYHLEQAEKCMVEGVDGIHLARLSFATEMLKEAYGPRLWPPRAPVTSAQ